MGRPLAKRFFGNRNIGTNGGYTADDGIGGEGIASISWSDVGSFRGTNGSSYLVGLALPAPTLPGGVQATWTLAFEVESVTTGAGKTNLAVGDTFTNAGYPGMIAKVTDISGTNAVFSVTTTGASRGATVLLGDLPTDSTGVTLTQTGGTGTAGTFLVDINFRIKASAIVITNKGSGYLGTETFTVTLGANGAGTPPAGTIVATTDSGTTSNGANAVDNQENAIIAYAYVTGNSLIADINAQKGSHRYRVTTSEGTAVCKLVAATPSAVGEMSITATDSSGKTYYVTKLTSHMAYLTQYGSSGWEFADGTAVRWTFDAPTLNTTVQIANA